MNKLDALVLRSCDMLIDYSKPDMIRKLKNVAKRLLGRSVAGRNYISWPTGLCALGLIEFIKNHPEDENAQKAEEALLSYYDRWIEKGSKIGRVEDVLAGYVLLELMEYRKEYSDRYSDAAEGFTDFLKNARTDKNGTYVYNPLQEEDLVLADMLGMVCPYLCAAKGYEGSTDKAVEQIKTFIDNAYDVKSGLLYHGYINSDGLIGKTGIIGWGRTMGWTLLGVSLTLTLMDRRHPCYDIVKEYLARFILSTARFIRDDGLFSWQLTKEGPEDTSGSAMIAYSLQKALSEGMITPADDHIYDCAREIVQKVRDALSEHITGDGEVTEALAECQGPGIHPQIYGSYPWSVGPTLALLSISR